MPRDIKIYRGLCLYGFYKIRRDRQIPVVFLIFCSFSFTVLFTAVILDTLNVQYDDCTRPMFPIPHKICAIIHKTVLPLT